MKKYILITVGALSLALGIVGIFLPVLPTTPFLLLSAYCFSKSSEKFYNWLITNKIFGKYIRDYREQKGITLYNKIVVLIVLFAGIGFSLWKMQNHLHLQIFLVVVLIGVTVHIVKLKTLKNWEQYEILILAEKEKN